MIPSEEILSWLDGCVLRTVGDTEGQVPSVECLSVSMTSPLVRTQSMLNSSMHQQQGNHSRWENTRRTERQ